MNDRRLYAADVLMTDLTTRHHHVRAASEEEVERKMRGGYPKAVAILVRQEEAWRRAPSRPPPVP